MGTDKQKYLEEFEKQNPQKKEITLLLLKIVSGQKETKRVAK